MHGDDLLLSDLLAAYLASPDAPTNADGPRILARFVEDSPGVTVGEFGPLACRAWIDRLATDEDVPGHRRYSITTVRRSLSSVKRLWRWAVSAELIAVERYTAILTVSMPSSKSCRAAKVVRAANPTHVEMVLPHLGYVLRAAVEVQRSTGMRPSELFRMSPGQIFQPGQIANLYAIGEIEVPPGIWIYAPIHWKTEHAGTPRWVALGERVQAILKQFHDGRPTDRPYFTPIEAWLCSIIQRLPTTDELTGAIEAWQATKPKCTADHYGSQCYRQSLRRACLKAGVPPINPYQIRHLYSQLVDREFGLDHAQAALGHSSPDMTKRYTRRSFLKSVEVARRIG